MIPNLSAMIDYEVVVFVIGGILSGLFGSGKSNDEDDVIVVDAHGIVIDALSDADRTAVTEVVTGRNWRDQITVEQAEDIAKEKELRGFWRRN